jgi:hypothetical protein
LLPKAREELAGQLGVVAVLSKGEIGMGALAGSANAEPMLHIVPGNFWRLGFDHEA